MKVSASSFKVKLVKISLVFLVRFESHLEKISKKCSVCLTSHVIDKHQTSIESIERVEELNRRLEEVNALLKSQETDFLKPIFVSVITENPYYAFEVWKTSNFSQFR